MRSVVVVDDQLAFRSAARRSLLGSARFTVVGEAESAEDALAMIGLIHPDLVVMDIRLPGIDGIEATRLLCANFDHPDVVLVSTYGINDLPVDVSSCGALGFVAKARFGPDALATVLDSAPHQSLDGAVSDSADFVTVG